VLEEVGLFDERYFAYCEEADLALRAKAAGWETGLIRGAIVVNPDLGTRIAVIDYLQLRNTLLLVREHYGRYHALIRWLLAVGQLAAGLASPARRGPYWDPRARARALVDHARNRYGAPPLSIQDRRR
jgi:GT2 family glycosyltransferase